MRDQTMRKDLLAKTISYLPVIGILLGAAVTAWLFALVTANFVEKRSFSSVSALFIREDLDWARVSVDGLEVMLTGVAPTEAMRFRALSLAGTVVDPARVSDNMSVARAQVTAPQFSIEILRNDNEISLIGLIPKEPDPAEYLAAITEASGVSEITNLMQTASYRAPAGWDAATEFSVAALTELPRSKISVSATKVIVSALSDSEADRNRLITQLRRLAPKGMTVELNIAAPRPAITPFTLRFVWEADGKPRFDACSADTEDAQKAILAAARAAGMEATPRCQIGLGSPTPRWGEAAVASIRAIAEMGGGTVTMSDTEISLQSLPDADRVQFETAVGRLNRALPDIFKLSAERTETTTEVVGVIELVARKDEDGKVFMRGPTASEREQEIVDAVAKANFGVAGLTNLTRIAQGLPAGWNMRVLAGLEALKQLESGEVVVRPDVVRISGQTGNQTTQDTVTRLLTDRLGEDADMSIDITYVEKLDPLLGLPTPLECVNRINGVLAEAKLAFSPGSSDIDAGSATQLNKLAEAFENCQDFPMEVAGHTDSQGRDEMNLQLSQDRAEAVIEALLARRVLTAQLKAKGYGETQPIGDNETEEGREANRRIEFRLLSNDGRIVVSGASAEGAEAVDPEIVPVERPDGDEGAETVTDAAVEGETGPAVDPELDPEQSPDAIPKPRPDRPEGTNE